MVAAEHLSILYSGIFVCAVVVQITAMYLTIMSMNGFGCDCV